MKVKLLKKLRKRFVFYYDKEATNQPWKLFDKESNIEIYAFETGLYYYSEMVIYAMMRRMGIIDLWESNRTRRERRIKARKLAALRTHYLQKERKLCNK